MIAFEVCDLVVAASRTLDLGTGATLDLLDLAAAEAALAEAGALGGDPAAGDPAAAAAALLCALVLRRPFRRGNDRVALVAALQLLAMHGCRANLEPPEATMSIIAGITAGEAGAAEVRNWLLPRLYRESEAEKWEAQMQNLLPARRRRRRADKSSGELFMRFNDEARQAIVLAHEEARTLDHGYIGTEHILLALTREGSGVAAQVLARLGADPGALREQVGRLAAAARRDGTQPGGDQQSA